MLDANKIINDLNKPNSKITVNALSKALENVKGATFATLTQASEVKIAKKHNQHIVKLTRQSLTITAGTTSNLYVNAVSKELGEQYQPLPSHYEAINDSYSLCALKSDPTRQYIRASVNQCYDSEYYDVNKGEYITKERVAEFLAPSAREKLLNPKKETYIQHADVTHTNIHRNFSLENIHSISLGNTTLHCQ